MTSHCPRRILPPGGTRKRKEREAPRIASGPPAASATASAYSASAREAGEAAKAMSSNRLLAGYMAHEFLTRGTLFGQEFESGGGEAASEWAQATKEDKSRAVAEMASVVKSDGTHIPGVVNPSQLSRWMQI